MVVGPDEKLPVAEAVFPPGKFSVDRAKQLQIFFALSTKKFKLIMLFKHLQNDPISAENLFKTAGHETSGFRPPAGNAERRAAVSLIVGINTAEEALP
jgi:hypothetical protein